MDSTTDIFQVNLHYLQNSLKQLFFKKVPLATSRNGLLDLFGATKTTFAYFFDFSQFKRLQLF